MQQRNISLWLVIIFANRVKAYFHKLIIYNLKYVKHFKEKLNFEVLWGYIFHIDFIVLEIISVS